MTTSQTRLVAATPWSTVMFTLVASAAFGVVVATALVYRMVFGTHISTVSAEWNNFGTFFGGLLGPILSMLAFFALIYTIFLQEQQLTLARMTVKAANEDKELTRKQLEASIEIQNKTANALALQNELAREQTATTAFFEMMRRQTELAVHASIGGYGGQALFKWLWENSLVATYKNDEAKETEILNRLDFDRRLATKVFNGVYGVIGPYFDNLDGSLAFIDKSSLSDEKKRFFASLLRAQLSRNEVALLFFFGLSESGWDMKELLEKYAFFRGIDRSFLINPYSYADYHPSAWGEN